MSKKRDGDVTERIVEGRGWEEAYVILVNSISSDRQSYILLTKHLACSNLLNLDT